MSCLENTIHNHFMIQFLTFCPVRTIFSVACQPYVNYASTVSLLATSLTNCNQTLLIIIVRKIAVFSFGWQIELAINCTSLPTRTSLEQLAYLSLIFLKEGGRRTVIMSTCKHNVILSPILLSLLHSLVTYVCSSSPLVRVDCSIIIFCIR